MKQFSRPIELIQAIGVLLGAIALCARACADPLPTPSSSAQAPQASFRALAPANAVALVGLDPSWLWNATAQERAEQPFRARLSLAQAFINVDIARDILPWIGRTYIVVLPTTGTGKAVAMLAEIKNRSQFDSSVVRMKANLEDRPQFTVAESDVFGIPITHVSLGDAGAPNFSFAVDRGWVIAGVGDSALQQVLNAASGKIPTLDANTGYIKTLAKIDDAHAAIWGAFSSAFFAPPSVPIPAAAAPSGAAGTANPNPWTPGKGPTASSQATSRHNLFSDFVAAFTLTDKQTTLRLDVTAYFADPHARDLIDEIKSTTKPLSGDSTNHMPNDISASLIVSNPYEWLSVLRELVAKSGVPGGPPAPDPFAGLAPFDATVELFTGEANLGWMKSAGATGYVGAFGTDSRSAANSAMDAFTSSMTTIQIPLEQDGSTYTISGTTHGASDALFPVSPTFRIDGSYFQAASAGQWLSLPEGTPVAALPKEALGSVAATVGRLRFLDDEFAAVLKANAGNGPDDDIIRALQKSGVDAGSWSGWANIDPTDETASLTLTLDSVDWKSLLNLVAQARFGPQAATPGAPPAK